MVSIRTNIFSVNKNAGCSNSVRKKEITNHKLCFSFGFCYIFDAHRLLLVDRKLKSNDRTIVKCPEYSLFHSHSPYLFIYLCVCYCRPIDKNDSRTRAIRTDAFQAAIFIKNKSIVTTFYAFMSILLPRTANLSDPSTISFVCHHCQCDSDTHQMCDQNGAKYNKKKICRLAVAVVSTTVIVTKEIVYTSNILFYDYNVTSGCFSSSLLVLIFIVASHLLSIIFRLSVRIHLLRFTIGYYSFLIFLAFLSFHLCYSRSVYNCGQINHFRCLFLI